MTKAILVEFARVVYFRVHHPNERRFGGACVSHTQPFTHSTYWRFIGSGNVFGDRVCFSFSLGWIGVGFCLLTVFHILYNSRTPNWQTITSRFAALAAVALLQD